MSDYRGIIISSFVFDGRALTVFGGGIDDLSLRQYLLYWDKIDYPANNRIVTGLSQDLEFLLAEGILQRTLIRFRQFSGNPGYLMALMQAMAHKIHNKKEPGQWAIAQKNINLFVPDEFAEVTRTVEVELYRSLPVPSSDMPIQEILEFKLKRRDELIAFRTAMDQLYLDIINANDIPRAKNSALNKVDLVLADLNSVANESWAKKLLTSLKVEINVPNLITNAAIGSGLALSIGFSPTAGAAIGAATAAIKFDLGLTTGVKNIPNELKDFAYLYRIETEL